jgi:hypothetical protein
MISHGAIRRGQVTNIDMQDDGKIESLLEECLPKGASLFRPTEPLLKVCL